MSRRFTLEALGEDAFLLRFGSVIDVSINAQVHAFASLLERNRPAWLLDIIPAFATLAVQVDVQALGHDECWRDLVGNWLIEQGDDASPFALPGAAHVHSIPVRYGGEHGPDLDDLARHAGLSPDEVIRRHCAAHYQVGMLGFAAGFPYLIGLDQRLSMPRHATPRIEVMAGSVGIGGEQTGIYPRKGPGGWQIIGRTEVTLFDVQRSQPALLAPGDFVEFHAVDTHGRKLA